MAARLNEDMGEHPNVGEIRQYGLMIGVELVKDRRTREPLRIGRALSEARQYEHAVEYLSKAAERAPYWAEPVIELGVSDYHILQATGKRVVGVKAEETDIQVSRDVTGGFEPRTPPDMPLDVAFDPQDRRTQLDGARPRAPRSAGSLPTSPW